MARFCSTLSLGQSSLDELTEIKHQPQLIIFASYVTNNAKVYFKNILCQLSNVVSQFCLKYVVAKYAKFTTL